MGTPVSVTLTIGGEPVGINAGDLANLASKAFSLAVSDDALANLLLQPVSSLPAGENGFQGALKFSPGTSWSLAGVPLTLTINANASADIAIVTSGQLLQYTNGLTDPQRVSVDVPAGSAYIKIEFDVAVDGNLAAQANLGASIGISGSAQAGVDYTIAYLKAIPLTTTLKDAIVQAVQSFTLPFHSGTLQQLGKGDYLYHTFAGNLALGFGVHYGVSGSLLSGRSVQEVQASFGSGIVSGSLSLAPTFKTSAGFDLTYKHNDFFEMLLHRDPAGPGDQARVHLFRADKTNAGLRVSAAINVDHGANFDITSNLGTVVDQIAAHVTGRLQDAAAKSKVSDAVQKLFGPATDAVQNFAGDVNQSVNTLLQTVSGRGVELLATIETQKSRVSLFNYVFDLTNGNVDKAWQSAITGDFVAAYQTPGHPVDLDQGSGVEREFIRRSGVSLNLFGLFQVSSALQFFTNSTLVYAGNSVFNLLFSTGIEWDTATHSSSSSAAITFCAAATSQGIQNVQGLQVTMKVELTDTARPDAAGLSAQLLADSNMPALQAAATQALSFAQTQRKGKLVVKAELLPSAYARLKASPFNGKIPPPLPQADDGANFSAFVAACRDLFSGDFFGGFPDVCRTFVQWQELNKSTNQIAAPDRRLFNYSQAPVDWPASDASRFHIVFNYIDAARCFMNLCDDLGQLSGAQQQVATPRQFQAVVDTLKFMVKNDADVWFTKPTLLALLLLAGTAVSNVHADSGLSGGTGQFTVSFQVQ